MIAPKDNSLTVIAKNLAEFFKDDPQKIVHWLFTNNPSFGNIAPADLIVRQRAHKVAQFILDVKNGHLP